MEVEFGNELGPDDFPTEVKITVNLEHGMPRDRDAIQSMFNRGMGRIYDIPDDFTGTADMQTRVDNATKTRTGEGKTGSIPWNQALRTSTMNMGALGSSSLKKSALAGSVSVWNNLQMKSISGDETFISNNVAANRSSFQKINWLALKGLT